MQQVIIGLDTSEMVYEMESLAHLDDDSGFEDIDSDIDDNDDEDDDENGNCVKVIASLLLVCLLSAKQLDIHFFFIMLR